MTDTVKAAADRLRERVRDWGARPDQPEGAVVDALALLLESFEEKLDTTRGLPLDKIAASMRVAAAAGLADAAKAFRRAQDRMAWAIASLTVAVALVAGATGGYAAGYGAAGRRAALDAADLRPAFHTGLVGTDWLASMVRNNDIAQLAAACRSGAYKVGDSEACRIQMWTGQRGNP
jgi:hypothetical protein